MCFVAIHELMHTMGFDHCQLWKCLMNTYCLGEEGKDDPTWLCPMDLRKL
jgi:predicted Zn-dependent protease